MIILTKVWGFRVLGLGFYCEFSVRESVGQPGRLSIPHQIWSHDVVYLSNWACQNKSTHNRIQSGYEQKAVNTLPAGGIRQGRKTPAQSNRPGKFEALILGAIQQSGCIYLPFTKWNWMTQRRYIRTQPCLLNPCFENVTTMLMASVPSKAASRALLYLLPAILQSHNLLQKLSLSKNHMVSSKDCWCYWVYFSCILIAVWLGEQTL